MLTALKQLILKWACMHDYQIEVRESVKSYAGFGFYETYDIYTYKCTKCGKFKQIKSS